MMFYGPVHLAYNPSYSACFFSQNNIFLLQKISQQCFQPAYNSSRTAPYVLVLERLRSYITTELTISQFLRAYGHSLFRLETSSFFSLDEK
jgi:hypothetical protein